MPTWIALIVALVYVACLFSVAWLGERYQHDFGPINKLRKGGVVYALTITIYNTAWSFYGSVGKAAVSGFDFLPIYIGPILVLALGQPILRRVIASAKRQNATSIADFIATRYGRSQTVAAVVTLISVVAVLPYIALQFKAVSESLTYISEQGSQIERPEWVLNDLGFWVAVAMANFVIIFGVRHVHAREHHHGLMLAIALESFVKLGSFLIVAFAIVYGMFGGFTDLAGRVEDAGLYSRFLKFEPLQATWVSNTVISMVSFVCLPQMFHVLIVENESISHLRPAARYYPIYLFVMSLFMAPIAIAGWLTFGSGLRADFYMIALPIHLQNTIVVIAAFVGGVSAAIGMVIMASVALSTMICNDVIIPLLISRGRSAIGPYAIADLLLPIRRTAVGFIVMLAYGMGRMLDPAYPLTDIGLMSFVGIAQFGPALIGGMIWRRANHAGAIAGLSCGAIVWLYTLVIPALGLAFDFFNPSGEISGSIPNWLSPHALFNVQGLDPITHATLWSLISNILALIIVSLIWRPTVIEYLASGTFTEIGEIHSTGSTRQLQTIASLYLGEEHAERAFKRIAPDDDNAPAASDAISLQSLQFTETLIAGAIGASSARIVMMSALAGPTLSRREAVAILDEASRAIQSGQYLLRSVLESVPQGICAFDSELRIKAWNQRFANLLALPTDMLRVGLSLSEIVAFNKSRDEYAGDDLKAIIINRDVGTIVWPYVYIRQRPDGTVLEISFDRTKDSGFISTYTDVTERYKTAEALKIANEQLEQRVLERTEELIHAKAEAERANLAKSQILTAVSHDLRQPLLAARLFASLLNRDELSPKSVNSLEGLQAAIRNGEDMLEALMDISVIEQGTLIPRFEVFSISDVLNDVSRLYSSLFDAKGLRFRVVNSSKKIISDRKLLSRAIGNLVVNAARYTKTGRVIIGCRSKGKNIFISIYDTGIGIAPEDQLAIFEPFVRLRRSNEEASGGLGLGLAIVDGLLRLLGHEITVRSVLGRGTEMRVRVARAALAHDPTNQKLQLPDHQLSILFILNNQTRLYEMMNIAENLNYFPVVVDSVGVATDFLQKSSPIAIVFDSETIVSKKILEDLKKIRDFKLPRIPIILLCTEPSDSILQQAAQLDISVFTNPVNTADLQYLLKRLTTR